MRRTFQTESVWRPFPPQLQSVQPLLPTQGVLGAHLVGRLGGGDVDLGVPGAALSCQTKRKRRTVFLELYILVLKLQDV